MGHVVIVGAGPAGAGLAWLLASRGIAVTLIERQRDFAREFRGEGLMKSGRDALLEMGLEKPFAEVPQVTPQGIDVHVDARLALSLTFPDADLAPRMVSQPAMLEMLVSYCAEQPGFRLLQGESVRDLVREDGRAVGVLLRGGEVVRADLVVGADGRASVVRRVAGLEQETDPERFDIVWFKVPYPDYLARRGCIAIANIARGHLALALPSWDERLQVAWVIRKKTFGDLKRRGIEAWVDEMAGHVAPELGAHLRRHSGELEHPFLLDVVCYLLPRWTAPGVLLLGDASHPMSPVGAQGLNIALRDAVVAANHLVPELGGTPDPAAVDAAGERFQSERYVEARLVQSLQRRPPSVIFGEAWWSGLALRALPLLRFAPARSLAFAAVGRAFVEGVTEVRLRV